MTAQRPLPEPSPLPGPAPARAPAGQDAAPDSDAALMLRTGAGDIDAFGQLVERYGGRMYRVAYRLLADAQDAEDAVQECFARLWQAAPAWDARGSGLLTWLQRVTTNLCLDRLRRFRVVPDGEVPDVEDPAPGPDHLLALRRTGHLTQRALGALPPRHRAALVLCYIEGLSNLAAADMLGLNLKAMESLLFRARRALREQLEQMGVAAEDLDMGA